MSILLGEDGGGYELARKLESRGIWKIWLGDSIYSSTFIHLLSSPSLWASFIHPPSTDDTPIHILHLQLRVRALLFDKASVSLFNPLPSSPHLSTLNPNYLELHGDDIYFTLENGGQDADQQWWPASNAMSSKGQAKTSIGSGELPETWYSQFIERYRASKSYRLMFSDRESEKRTPEQMSTYLRVLENHKRRRVAFKEISNPRSNLTTGDSDMVDDMLFFPETMFTLNCVPDGAVLKTSEPRNNKKMQINGVLDNLPQIMTKSPMMSPIMIERLGIKPEYLSMDQTRGNDGSKGGKKLLGQEQAAQMSQKVVVRLLNKAGFESSSSAPLEIMIQFLSSHIGKLGGKLKLLSDSYKHQCSAIELLKMFLQTTGYRNLGPLTELVKDNTRNAVQQTQQVQGIQAQVQSQQPPTIQQAQQQNLRHMSPQMQMQMQQMNNPQYIAYQQQQQWERMRKWQQQSTPRPGMNMNTNVNMNTNMDKDRPLVQVKMEKQDIPLDTNAFTAMNSRHPHFQQLRQQQLAAMSLHAQTNNQFRPVNSVHLQQLQSMNMGMARAQPVKVEGFQELMGGLGDSSMKHDPDENKMLSPPQQ